MASTSTEKIVINAISILFSSSLMLFKRQFSPASIEVAVNSKDGDFTIYKCKAK